ncbi:MAG: RnfABCDGE type electron transport complex subunit D [Candidatus Levybacteria bacterium]|nr:RnfABCDGE type electron transport complex subunit D [Candidatus Levybacteria bacterium]
MKNLILIPKVQLSFTLILIYLSAVIHSPSMQTVLYLFLALSSTLISDFIFIKIRKLPSFLLSSAIVSGLIIGLLTAPSLPPYAPIIAGVLAMFSKNFIRIEQKHIFNPAGFGLFLEAFIFRHNISWWAVSWQKIFANNFLSIIFFIVLLSPFLISAFRMRRYFNQLSFFATNILIILIMNIVAKYMQHQAAESLFDPTFIFFAAVMLPEPMTTPYHSNRQLLFGFLVAIISFIIIFPPLVANLLPDTLIFSLLTVNALFLRFR